MSIMTEDNRTAELTTDGAETEFDFAMLIHADSEVQVWYEVTGGEYTLLTLDTDYTVSFTEDGGTVTTIGGSSPRAAGKILIIRHIELTMETNWLYNDNHSEQQHQDDFDRSVMRDLQIQEQLDRCLLLETSSGTTGLTLPEPDASKFLQWKTDLSGLQNVSAIDAGLDAISDIAYNATTWNANLDAASKNAIRDKIESMDYAFVSGNDAATDITAAQLEQLSDGSETALHIHDDRYYPETEADALFVSLDGETIDITNGAFDLTTTGDIIGGSLAIDSGGQDYNFTAASGNILTVQGQTSATPSRLEMRAADDDGSDQVLLSTAFTEGAINKQFLFGWNGNDFQLGMFYSGADSANAESIRFGIKNVDLNMIRLLATGPVVINEDGVSTTDFRVETDTTSNAFFMNAGANTAEFNVPLQINASVEINSSVRIIGGDGINYAPPTPEDADIDIATVDVTGTPTFGWDETNDRFVFNKPVAAPAFEGTSDIHLDENTIFFSKENSASIFVDVATPFPGDAWTFRTDNILVTRLVLRSENVDVNASNVRTFADTTQFKWSRSTTSRPWMEADFDTRQITIGDDFDDVTDSIRFKGAIALRSLRHGAAGPTDDLDVSGVNIVFIDCSEGDVVIGGFAGGVDGQVLHVVKLCSSALDATLEHAEPGATQQILLHKGLDETLNSEYGGWSLVCDGTNWYDMSHAKHIE